MTDRIWNPSYPDGRAGVEWSAFRDGFVSMRRGLAGGRLQQVNSTAAENIIQWLWCSESGQGGRYMVEVFLPSNVVPDAAATIPAVVTIADSVTNVTDYTGSVVPASLVAALNDGSDGTGLVFTKTVGGRAYIDLGFNPGAGGRILAVGAIGKVVGKPGQYLKVDVITQTGGVEDYLEDLDVMPAGGAQFPVDFTSSSPQQACGSAPWSTSNLADFNSAPNGKRLRLELAGSNAPGDFLLLSELRLAVVVCTENRVAWGVGGVVGGANGGTPHTVPTWQTAPVQGTPAGSGPWVKGISTVFSVVVRPLDKPGPSTLNEIQGQGDYRWRYIEAADPMMRLTPFATAGPGSADVTVDQYGRITGVGPLTERRSHAVAFRTSAGGNPVSVDSQPYSDWDAYAPAGLQAVVQEITDADGTYGWVRLPVRRTHDVDPAVGLPDEQLLLSIVHVTGGNPVVGQTYLLPEQFLDDQYGSAMGDGWRMMELPLNAPAALVAGQKYRIQAACIDPNGPWQVAGLNVTDPTPIVTAAVMNAKNYGGTTFQGGTFTPPSTVVLVPSFDAQFSVVVQRDPLLDFTVDADGQQTFENLAACGVDAVMPFVRMSWAVDPDAAPVGMIGTSITPTYVEVQRADTVGDTRWHTIRRVFITSAGKTGCADYESWPEVLSGYRARFMSYDGSHSDWTDPLWVTCPAGPPICFTTNARPELNIGCVDAGDGRAADRSYTSLDGIEYAALDDRDMQVGLLPLEERGWRFARTVLVGDGPPSRGSISQFDGIKRLARAGRWGVETADESRDGPIPYVCVRERDGGRFYAGLRLVETTIRLRHGRARHLATVEATSVRPVPTPIDR